ncbi:MAG: hypothetical protein WC607_00090 [Candidatus Micrarchaeia archaeon]
MSYELGRLRDDAGKLKNVLLQGRNVGVLLYLAKYNPNVDRKKIEETFGKNALDDLEQLKKINLVIEEKESLTLTDEGIFQVNGLVKLI